MLAKLRGRPGKALTEAGSVTGAAAAAFALLFPTVRAVANVKQVPDLSSDSFGITRFITTTPTNPSNEGYRFGCIVAA